MELLIQDGLLSRRVEGLEVRSKSEGKAIFRSRITYDDRLVAVLVQPEIHETLKYNPSTLNS